MKLSVFIAVIILICTLFSCNSDDAETGLNQPKLHILLTKNSVSGKDIVSQPPNSVTEYSVPKWQKGELNIQTAVDVHLAGKYHYHRSYHRYPEGDVRKYYESDLKIPRFDTVFDSLKTAFLQKPDVRFFSMSVYLSDQLKPGINRVSGKIYYNLVFRNSLSKQAPKSDYLADLSSRH